MDNDLIVFIATTIVTPWQWVGIVAAWIVVTCLCVGAAFGITYFGRKLYGWDDEGKNRMQVAALAGVFAVAAFFGFFWLYAAFPDGAADLDLYALGLTFAGALVGFLFGVPKSITTTQSNGSTTSTTAPATTAGSGLQVNTNLDKVSDWLTTIVTGLALTQLVRLPSYADRFAAFIGHDFPAEPHIHVLAVAMLLYFPLLGFFTAYIATRVILSRVFKRADESLSALSDDQKAAVMSVLPRLFEIPENASAEEKAAAQSVAKTPYADMKTPSDRATWARAQAIIGNYKEAIPAFKQALDDYPNDCGLWQDYALALFQGDAEPAEVISALEKALTLANGDKDAVAKIYSNEALAYLYMLRPDGYLKAIDVCNRVLGDSSLPKHGVTYFYRACAYGQQYADAKKAADAKAMQAAGAFIIGDAKQALFMRPDLQNRFKLVAQPGFDNKPSYENDLEIFAADSAEFRQLIGLS